MRGRIFPFETIPREFFVPPMVTGVSSVLLCFLAISGFPGLRCSDSAYLYPLADYIGTTEVMHGREGTNDSLGTVGSFSSHPSLPYNTLYFYGNASSYAELLVGTQSIVENDWSFTMFVYSKAPHRGTIFDYEYDGTEELSDPLLASKIKLELTDLGMVLTLNGPGSRDHGSAVIGTIFNEEAWIPLSIIHDEATGDLLLQTTDNEIYNSAHFQNNRNNVKLPQPAKIKLGGSYDILSEPFEGSIVCFALYDTKMNNSDFDATLTECLPDNWPVPSSTYETTVSTTTSDTPTLPPTTCPRNYGYFITVAMDTKPNVTAILALTSTISNRKCGQICLQKQDCLSFTYNKVTTLCSLFNNVYDINVEPEEGTRYYKRREAC